jgi:hypothetical protein
MLLKMTAGLSGPLFSLSPGDEHEFETDEAKRLIEAGFAEEAAAQTPAEPAAAPVKTKKGKPDVVSGQSDDGSDGGAGNA